MKQVEVGDEDDTARKKGPNEKFERFWTTFLTTWVSVGRTAHIFNWRRKFEAYRRPKNWSDTEVKRKVWAKLEPSENMEQLRQPRDELTL